MGNKRVPERSLDEWMDLVIQCRQSGLTDAAWCNKYGISPSCFYNAVTRLQKKACQIPEPAGKASTLDLTATLDGEEAYKNADFVVIAAPTNYDSKKTSSTALQ